MKNYLRFLFCAAGIFSGCNNTKDETRAQMTLPDKAEVVKEGSLPVEELMMDSLELCTSLIKEKSVNDFVRNQPVTFEVTNDTVINDERGIFVGKRLSIGTSFIQWLDDSTVSKMSVSDARIKLNCGIRVGMSKEECRTRFKLGNAKFDTLSFGYGFLDNGCDLYFKNGYLRACLGIE
ncbi:hypothetical protein LRS06_16395 [Hymenobacter sp. J193]|uniref:hypothetical protein n=1 Tax=Hymenobacter sp. J193 TaxID=2898429 RepID=UPI002150E77D|nr:hypothetical protein [Hymenobacter sp. J193]MCR5889316.1 hypothetical protein [Hymenobacter sp. J193]